jgi:hypothetical protein
MKRRIFLLAFLMCAPVALLADQQADSLYKQSQATNDQQAAVDLLCKAADLDPATYGKKCNDAKQYLDSRLQKFDGLFISGKAKFDAKQYADAVSDLSKIYFGPHRPEAQQLIAQANDAINHPQPVDNSAPALKAAQVAYDNGDFATAETNAGLVKSPELLPQAQSLLSNIRNYRDDMQQAEAFKTDKNYTAALQKYNAALAIKVNGPGNPAAKLQEVADLMKQQNSAAVAAIKQSVSDSTAKIKADLSDARDQMAKGNLQGALNAYNQVLTLNPKEAEAISGKEQVQQAMQTALAKDPKALEDTLVGGIRSYYESHFTEAHDAIELYLKVGGTRSKGAAYFYLGATILSQAILSSPKSIQERDHLQHDALEQFQQAKQEHFRPVEKFVSPKILAVWNQAGM